MADYHIEINPDADLDNNKPYHVQIDADNDNDYAMDQAVPGFRTVAVPPGGGDDYHVAINPDADLDTYTPYHVQIDADNDNGYAMDQVRSWFRTIYVQLSGGDYHVEINPDADFASDEPVHFLINVADVEAQFLVDEFFWFRVAKAFSGFHVDIDPDDYLEELTQFSVQIDSSNIFALPSTQTTWFITAEFSFYTDLTGEWVNLEEDGTKQKGQLQRFLKLTSFTLDEIKAKIDAFPTMLNVDKTDADILPLLASLLGVDCSYDLSIPHQREEIKHAVNVYKRKGTIPSIKQFCRSVFGINPEIEEWARRIMVLNDPDHILPPIDTSGALDKGGLVGDPIYYLLDFSDSGDYRFDKFGIYFELAQFAGIPRPEAEKILRLIPKKIPASTEGKLIFVTDIYQFGSADDLSLETFYHAYGTGNESWDNNLPFPPVGQTTLVNEIHRRKPDSIVYLDSEGKVTQTPSNRFRMVSILRHNEIDLDGKFLREQGLFGGAATQQKDSGTLYGIIWHNRQWKSPDYEIIKTLELSHALDFIVDQNGDFLVFGIDDFVVG